MTNDDAAVDETTPKDVPTAQLEGEMPVEHPAATRLEAWFDDHVRNSILSMDVTVHNAIRHAVDGIKQIINQKAGA